uniref:hypothetical protein n=1 Tax=Pseudomonas sp. KK4 TaxID=1855729 RepID=UPI0011157EC2
MSSKIDESSSESQVAESDLNPYAHGQRFGLPKKTLVNPVIITPSQMSQHPAGTSVLLSGTCATDAKIEVYSLQGKMGDAVVIGFRWYFYVVWGEAAHPLYTGLWLGWIGHGAGSLSCFVIQTVGNDRIQSGTQTFSVGNLEKSPVPQMGSPENGSEHPIGDPGIILWGICDLGAGVDVAIDGAWYVRYAVEHSGVWFSTNWSSYPRTVTYQVRQTVPGYLPSDPGPLVTVKYVGSARSSSEKLCDAASTNAQKPGSPTIVSPANGTNQLVEKELQIVGECAQGATVIVEENGEEYTASVVGTRWFSRGRNKYYLDFGASLQFRVKQQVNGSEFSDYSHTVTVNFVMSPPLVLFPVNGVTYSAVNVYVSGVCDQDAEVEIIAAQDGAVLG